MLMFPYIYGYIQTKGKRKIILTEQEIGFFHDDISLETIKMNEITAWKFFSFFSFRLS